MPVSKQVVEQVYQELGIEFDNLGCVMLDVEPIKVSDVISEDELYYSPDPVGGKYTQGIVSETLAHVTLLFGLMESGVKWKPQVDELLDGWNVPSVEIESVSHFPSANPGVEPYYCIVAKLKVTPGLLDGHERLENLPHISSFGDEYIPHITLAYIKQNDAVLYDVQNALGFRLVGMSIRVLGTNYGS